jgi:hypothetical protein
MVRALISTLPDTGYKSSITHGKDSGKKSIKRARLFRG